MDPRIAFAVQWAPHGGGASQDIYDLFGCTVPEFYRQVLAVLDSIGVDSGRGLPAVVVDRVRAVSRRRLWLGQ